MNLHKILAIALLVMSAPSINAGIFFYDDAEIEAKKSDSYEIDPIAGTVTAEFKHNYETRKDMVKFEGIPYLLPALAGMCATTGAALCILCNYMMLNDTLTPFSWNLSNEGGLTKSGLIYCKSVLSDLNKSLIALPVAALATYYFCNKLNQIDDKVAKLPREERVTVAKIAQK